MTTPTDPRLLYRRALDQTGAIVGAVRPDQLGLPTPCPDFDVAALLGHVVRGLGRVEALGLGADAVAVSDASQPAPDGWPAAFDAARRRAEAAWAGEGSLDRQVSMPWGTVSGREALLGFLVEVTTHGWDLATATGQPAELDAEIGSAALAAAGEMVGTERGTLPFGPVVPVAGNAGVYARLAAWLGRAPGSADARVATRAQLLPEELAAGSDAPVQQAAAILADSDARTTDQNASPTTFVEHRTSAQATDPE